MNKVSIPQSFEQIAQPPRSVPPQTETRFHHHQEQSKKDYNEQSLHTSEFLADISEGQFMVTTKNDP